MGIDGSRQTNLTNNPANDEEPSWSPDGMRIAFVSDRDGNKEIYTMSADGSDPMRLTSELGNDRSPVWSPNGSQIAFVFDRDSGALFAVSADGSETRNISGNSVKGFSWSPDGSRMAFISSSSLQLYLVNPDGSGLVELTQSIKGFGKPEWSPKGDKIAFASYHEILSGAIYIVNIEGGELRRIGTESSLDSFSWSPDGARFATRGTFGRGGLFILDIDSGNLTQLYEGFVYQPVWMPDAQGIGFFSNGEVYSLQINNGYIAANLTNNPGGHNNDPDWWWPRM